MANGILVIDKSAGWTSQDVAAKLRGVFHERRVGHGGTLDPMATGVLPVFIGRATRAAEFLESAEKEYVAGLRLGVVTDTQDTSGTVLETNPVCVTRAQLEAALRQFLGPIEQIPPMYSAIKIHGQKLYELARRGQEVARKPRSITIHALELLDGDGTDWRIRVHCSSSSQPSPTGQGYIRSPDRSASQLSSLELAKAASRLRSFRWTWHSHGPSRCRPSEASSME